MKEHHPRRLFTQVKLPVTLWRAAPPRVAATLPKEACTVFAADHNAAAVTVIASV
jgi:hypothetical protein